VNDRNFFYLPIAVVAAMLIAALAGHLWLPHATVELPLVEGCRLERQACAAALPGGGRLEMALAPRPPKTSAPLHVSVTVSGLQPAAVEVSFTGVAMNMGVHRLTLSAQDDRFTGQTTLPVCVTGSMEWQAAVSLDSGRERIVVPFRFESGH
jgi:hypothetical protein